MITGRVWKFGDHVDTDVIIPGRYLNLTDPVELAKHVFEPVKPGFYRLVKPGDVIVAGENFGCGSSREHAVIALKHAGISAVIAKSFARIFFRNAINLGLPALICPDAYEVVNEGDRISIDLGKGVIRVVNKGLTLRFKPYPPFILELLNAGGLVPYLKKKLGGA